MAGSANPPAAQTVEDIGISAQPRIFEIAHRSTESTVIASAPIEHARSRTGFVDADACDVERN